MFSRVDNIKDLYSYLFEYSLDFIFVQDLDGRLTDINDIALKHIGFTKEKICSMVSDLIKIVELKKLKRVKIKNKDGNYIYLEIHGIPLKKNGKISEILVIGRNISLQNSIKQNLEESLENYRLIAENANDLIAVVNEDLDHIYVNEYAYQKILGYSYNEMLGIKAKDIIHPEDFDRFRNYHQFFQQAGDNPVNESREQVRIRHKRGHYIWVESVAKTFTDNQGHTKLIVISRDIDDRKKIESELKESEESLRIILEKAVPAFSLIDLEGKILMVNNQGLELTGYSREEFLQMNAADIAIEVDPLEHKQKIWKTLPVGKHVKVVGMHKRKDGSFFPAETTLIRINLKSQPVIAAFARDITKSTKAEQKLKGSEEMYRLISEHANDIISITNNDGIFLYCSEAINRILSYNPEKIIGTLLFDLVHPENLNYAYQELEKLNKTGALEAEIRIRHKNGSYKWFESTARGIYDKHNKITKVISISRDITERKEAEIKLKESEEKFRTISEQSMVGIGIIQNAVFVYANDTLANLGGYTVEEVLNLGQEEFLNIIVPEDRKIMIDNLKHTLLSDKTDYTGFNLKCMKKNGDIVWVKLILKKIQYKENPAILGIVIDITDQISAEQRLLKSKKMYKTERDNLVNILNSMEDGVYIVNQQYDVEYANPALTRVFGSFKGKKCYDYIQNCSEVCHWCKMDEVIRGETIRSEKFYKELQKTYDIIDTPLTKADGSIVKLQILRDITDRKEAERLILEENKKLIELDNMREELITRISHELKTPLVPLINGSELLTTLYKDRLGREAQEIIEMINESALRLKALITNLLDASVLEYNEFEISRKKENLVEIIRNSMDELSYYANNRQLNLKTSLPESIYLNVDKPRITQVIVNILSNAIKNTPTGGEIYINAEEYPSYIDVKIQDTGVGLTDTEKQRLFTRFGKIERYGKGLDVDIEGSGLGLYISKQIVELHNGEIFVESRGRNKGSIFTIRLFKE